MIKFIFCVLFTVTGITVFSYGVIYSLLILISDCDLELFLCEKFGKSPKTLKGKVVFITGASSGIGEFTAYALAKFGVRLVLTARRTEELQRVKRQCLEISKGQLEDKDVLVIPMDVTDFDSHRKHFDHAVAHFGHVDILFNNAGRSQRANWESIELEVDKEVFALNVFSVVNLSRIAVEHFKKRGGGHIAVVSSIAGVLGAPFSASYTGSKHAIQGYFKALQVEKMEENIHATLLCPGPTFTNFLAECFTGKDGEKYNGSVQPTDRRMTGERCGYLNAVALANKTKESWMAVFPIIPLTYIAVYFPVTYSCGLKILRPSTVFKLRDSKPVEVRN